MIEMKVYRVAKFDAERVFNKILEELQQEHEIINVVPLNGGESGHYGILVRPLTTTDKYGNIQKVEFNHSVLGTPVIT